eukprot:1254303-Prorocentrum_lima.AAC.1
MRRLGRCFPPRDCRFVFWMVGAGGIIEPLLQRCSSVAAREKQNGALGGGCRRGRRICSSVRSRTPI